MMADIKRSVKKLDRLLNQGDNKPRDHNKRPKLAGLIPRTAPEAVEEDYLSVLRTPGKTRHSFTDDGYIAKMAAAEEEPATR